MIDEPSHDVEVTYTLEHKVTVKVPDAPFTGSLGPLAARDPFGPRGESLMAAYIQKQIARGDETFRAIPEAAHVVRVDVK